MGLKELLDELEDSGKLDEVLNVSDRIAIVNNGELVGIVNAKSNDSSAEGLGFATEQSPAANKVVEKGSIINVNFIIKEVD